MSDNYTSNINLSGVEVRFSQRGNGTPLLLLHGGEGPFEDKRDYFATSVLSESISLNFDSEGRVSIPEKLLKHAKIKSKIIFVGLGKVFQMWDPSLFEKFKLVARKKSYINRSALKWDNKFKKEGV